MEEVSISELSAFTVPARADLFVAVDGAITKKITYGSIVDTVSGDLDIISITGITGELGTATGLLSTATGVIDAKTVINETNINILSGTVSGRPDFCIICQASGGGLVGADDAGDGLHWVFGGHQAIHGGGAQATGKNSGVALAYGVPQAYPCRLVRAAISLHSDANGCAFTGTILKNGSAHGTLTGKFDDNEFAWYQNYDPPKAFAIGDRFNFRTQKTRRSDGATSPSITSATAAFYFQVEESFSISAPHV